MRSTNSLDYSIPFLPFGKHWEEEPPHKLAEILAAASASSAVWVLADLDTQVTRKDPGAIFGKRWEPRTIPW
jgi:hypothetical protein